MLEQHLATINLSGINLQYGRTAARQRVPPEWRISTANSHLASVETEIYLDDENVGTIGESRRMSLRMRLVLAHAQRSTNIDDNDVASSALHLSASTITW